MSERENYYEILGVNPGASAAEVTEAYRYEAYLHHPDRLAGVPDSVKRRAVEDLKKINRAYEVLGDPRRRERYDAELARKKHPPRAGTSPAPRKSASPHPQPARSPIGIINILNSRPVLSTAKILVSLLVMAVFIFMLWTVYELFVQSVDPVSGTVRLVALLVLLAGTYYLVNRSEMQRAWPEFALIFWLVLLLVAVAAFAGVQPLAQVKDDVARVITEELNRLRLKR